jgi:hypothetical protein
MFSFIKKIVFTVVAVALLLFLYQNMEPLSQTIGFNFDLYVEDFSYATPRFPVLFMFLAAFLMGTLLIGFHGLYERIARKAELKFRDRKIKALEKEVSALKAELLEADKPAATPESGKADKPAPGAAASAIIKSERPEPVKSALITPVVEKPVPEKPALTPLEEEPTL